MIDKSSFEYVDRDHGWTKYSRKLEYHSRSNSERTIVFVSIDKLISILSKLIKLFSFHCYILEMLVQKNVGNKKFDHRNLGSKKYGSARTKVIITVGICIRWSQGPIFKVWSKSSQ